MPAPDAGRTPTVSRKHRSPPRLHTCRCGREVRGNAYVLHLRACPAFLAHALATNPDLLVRRGITREAAERRLSRDSGPSQVDGR